MEGAHPGATMALRGLGDEVAGLRRQLAELREELELERALLRQDLATKVMDLRQVLPSRHELVQLIRKLHRQVLCLRADSQCEHRALMETFGLPLPVDRWPGAREWAEVRALDPIPRPTRCAPDDHEDSVSVASAESRRHPTATLSEAARSR